MSDAVVKSVGRVFAILELFDRERRPLTAAELARTLDYPHTSALAILKSMTTLGYLSHYESTRTYFPSFALPQVAEWITSAVEQETIILRVMEDLHEQIDETINLSRQTGDFLKIVHGLESRKLLGIRVRSGVLMTLTGSHTGRVMLATYPDDEIRRILDGLRKRSYPNTDTNSVDRTLREVKKIRGEELSSGYDTLVEGIGIVAFPLSSETGARPFVVAVAGPTERIRANEKKISSVARRAIKKHRARLAYPA